MKKLIAILGMITCMIGLTACGEKVEDTAVHPISEADALTIGDQMVGDFWQIVSQGVEEQFAGNEAIYNGLIGFKSALDDIGDYQNTDGGTVEFENEEIIISMNVVGSGHNAVVEIVLDEETGDYVSIATNVTYSLGEKMEKAALNTLLGMGTVFVVLILISLIISCFALIPKLFAPKKKEEAKEEKIENNVVAQIMEKEELSDDLELVAVISAAIAAYEGSGSTDGFVVRSIRKAYKK